MAYTLTYHYNQQALVLTNDHMNQKVMMLKDSVKKNKERKRTGRGKSTIIKHADQWTRYFLMFNFSSLSVTCDISLCYFYRLYSLLFIIIFAWYNVNEWLCVLIFFIFAAAAAAAATNRPAGRCLNCGVLQMNSGICSRCIDMAQCIVCKRYLPHTVLTMTTLANVR